MKGDSAFMDIVNRRRDSLRIVDRIERNLDIDMLASRLNRISARRRVKAVKR